MLRKFLTTAIGMASITIAFSQDSTVVEEKKPTVTISGSLDAYYRYNFQNAKDSGRLNNLTSFTNSQNSFELGMASLKAEASFGKAGAVVDLGFGRRATEFSYNDGGVLAAIKQAYVTFAPSDKIKFSFGKWGTHVGYEVLDAYLNRNYSMSYMFSYGPFFHTGLKADVALGNFGFMLGIVNPTDFVSASFTKKNVIAQVSGSSSSGKLKGYLNYVGGKDYSDTYSANQIDLVLLGTVTDQFSVGYNGTYKSLKDPADDKYSFWGSALYLNLDPSPTFGVTLRGEIFDDKKNGTLGYVGTSMFAGTLSANIKIDNLTIIPELRVDSAKDPYFFKNSDSGNPTSKGTGSFILAATYHF